MVGRLLKCLGQRRELLGQNIDPLETYQLEYQGTTLQKLLQPIVHNSQWRDNKMWAGDAQALLEVGQHANHYQRLAQKPLLDMSCKTSVRGVGSRRNWGRLLVRYVPAPLAHNSGTSILQAGRQVCACVPVYTMLWYVCGVVMHACGVRHAWQNALYNREEPYLQFEKRKASREDQMQVLQLWVGWCFVG